MATHRADDARIFDILIDISAECPFGHVTAGIITDRYSHFLSGREDKSSFARVLSSDVVINTGVPYTGSGYRSGVSVLTEAPFSLKKRLPTHQEGDYWIEFSGSKTFLYI